jgi:transcriptional regulator with XRE-family HTH domain
MNGHGLNLFKPRTLFGKWMDENHISQRELMDVTGLNKDTISSLCNDKNADPHVNTKMKIIGALRRNGYDVSVGDFW